jgi:hypothetical protein
MNLSSSILLEEYLVLDKAKSFWDFERERAEEIDREHILYGEFLCGDFGREITIIVGKSKYKF